MILIMPFEKGIPEASSNIASSTLTDLKQHIYTTLSRAAGIVAMICGGAGEGWLFKRWEGTWSGFFSVATKWISMNYCTPQNRTCNLQKSSFFEKENHLPDLHYCVSCQFSGVYPIWFLPFSLTCHRCKTWGFNWVWAFGSWRVPGVVDPTWVENVGT